MSSSNKSDFTSPLPPVGTSGSVTDIAVIASVVTVVIVVLVILIVVVLRYMCRNTGTYCTNEAKGTEFAESADAALKNDPSLQHCLDESKKEYFM